MAKIDFAKFTPDNGEINKLSELLFLADYEPDSLGAMFNVLPGQVNGKKVGFVGSFGLVGKAAQGCDPTYNDSILTANEQTWDIRPWDVAESLCFEDLEGTIFQVALRKGTRVADLTNTDYMDYIINPKIEMAIRQMKMRLAWFGDTAAESVADGGVIADAGNVPYFTVTDGFWKRLYLLVTANAQRRTTIAANAQTTFAAQDSGIKAAGVATGILNSLIMDAPIELRQAADQRIYITLSLADALKYDLQQNNKGSELQWESLFDGIQRTTYQGIELIVDPYMDKVIKGYEGVTGGKAWNKPYRAIYTTKSNMLIGVPGTSDVEDVEVFFDQKDRKNYIYVRDAMGTMIADPNLVQVAY